jgi:3-isopropylmalate dehydrogenase
MFCKFTPVRPIPALGDTGVLRPAALSNVDLVVVRENAGGEYFGQWRRWQSDEGEDSASHTYCYRASEVRRILDTAIRLATQRRGHVALVVKPGLSPAVSSLWMELFTQMTSDSGLATKVLEVDNAAYQIVANAPQFDVIVAPNLAGDILSDVAALLLGSRGLSYSANYGPRGAAVYQTGHGAAHDLAGRDVANPIGQILSAAVMLRESFGLDDLAAAIETAIHRTLAGGWRTADIAARGCRVVGTRALGECIAQALQGELSRCALAS